MFLFCRTEYFREKRIWLNSLYNRIFFNDLIVRHKIKSEDALRLCVRRLAESVMQLTGRCGDRQLGKLAGTKEPALIACSDNGAVFQGHAAMILERGE